uniref:uncharacterized protein LOC118540130 n=1 Tax=Halichoerus grypus TaxID=9711 RepID=UPI001659E852|nr:uncharacterized protein LOC118540130 [Halichoerus grypus]
MYLIYGLSPRLQSVSGVSKEETPPGSSGTETPRPVMLRSSRAAVLVVTALHAGRRSLCRADAQSSGESYGTHSQGLCWWTMKPNSNQASPSSLLLLNSPHSDNLPLKYIHSVYFSRNSTTATLLSATISLPDLQWKTQDLESPKRTGPAGGQGDGEPPLAVHCLVPFTVCTLSLLARIASYIIGCACIMYILTNKKINSVSEKIHHAEKVG